MQVQREVGIHSDLSHDNIVKVYATFADDKATCMVLEHVGGQSLESVVHEAGGFLHESVVAQKVLRPLLSALSYLHAKVSCNCITAQALRCSDELYSNAL